MSEPRSSRAKEVFDSVLGFAVLIGGSVYVLANWRDMPDWVQTVFVVFAGMFVLAAPVWCYQGFRLTQRLLFPKAFARYEARRDEKERRGWEKAMRKAEVRAELDKAVHPWLRGMLWFIASMLALMVAHFVFRLI